VCYFQRDMANRLIRNSILTIDLALAGCASREAAPARPETPVQLGSGRADGAPTLGYQKIGIVISAAMR
jgi:hypothetical protein